MVFFLLAKLGNIFQNLFQKVEEFLTVDVVLKCKLDVVVENLLEYLVGSLLVDSLPVRNKLNVFLSFFVVHHIRLRSSCLSRNYDSNWFFNPALIEKHVS